MDESRDSTKVLVDAENGQIVGAAILGIDWGKVMSMFQNAMVEWGFCTSLAGGELEYFVCGFRWMRVIWRPSVGSMMLARPYGGRK